jgi:hypothetical protein
MSIRGGSYDLKTKIPGSEVCARFPSGLVSALVALVPKCNLGTRRIRLELEENDRNSFPFRSFPFGNSNVPRSQVALGNAPVPAVGLPLTSPRDLRHGAPLAEAQLRRQSAFPSATWERGEETIRDLVAHGRAEARPSEAGSATPPYRRKHPSNPRLNFRSSAIGRSLLRSFRYCQRTG